MNSPQTPSRRRYPSDLTDGQWERVSPFLPRRRATGRPRLHGFRDVLDAINYRWETGCAWRMLPHDFPPWGTVYTCFRTWQRCGVLRQVRDALIGRRSRSRNDLRPMPKSSEWPVHGRENPDVPVLPDSIAPVS